MHLPPFKSLVPWLLASSVPFLLAGCTQLQVGTHLLKKAGRDSCVAEGSIKVGKPYMVDGIRYGNADAVLLASLLHYGEYTVDSLKDTMERCGIPVRRLVKNG